MSAQAHDLNADFGFDDHPSPGAGQGDVKFTITNGQVTGLERVIGTKTIALNLPSNATFTVGTGTVTETLTFGTTTETRTYKVDTSDSTLYHLSQDVRTFDTTATTGRTYGFTISNGAVTAVTEGTSASTHTHTIDVAKLPGTSFTVSGNTVTEISVHDNVVETEKYVTTDGSTYKLASDTLSFISAGTSTTALSVEPEERLSFTFSGTTVTATQAVKLDGTTASLPAKLAATYSELAAGYVLQTVTVGTHSYYEVFHDGNGDGIYTAVAHGTGTTVDLVGLQTQINAQVNALT